MIMLSPHFTLAEMTRSETALRYGINNTPSPYVLENLKLLAAKLEIVRAILGCPVHVTSALLVEALERIVAWRGFTLWCGKRGKHVNDASWAEYFVTKAHPKGLSADFEAPAYGSPEAVFNRLRAAKSQLGYDQLILEFPPDGWVHIGFAEAGKVARGENLMYTNSGPELVA